MATNSGGNSVSLNDAQVKNNLSATTDPGVSNDITEGYTEGSVWVNTSTPEAFMCVDNSSGAAVWDSVTAGAAPGGASITWEAGDLTAGLLDLTPGALDIAVDAGATAALMVFTIRPRTNNQSTQLRGMQVEALDAASGGNSKGFVASFYAWERIAQATVQIGEARIFAIVPAYSGHVYLNVTSDAGGKSYGYYQLLGTM